MPRRREVPKRDILPDPKFGNVEISKFMNVITTAGKKAVGNASCMARWTSSAKRRQGPAEVFSTALGNAADG